jgi:hypothetical protein
LTTAGSPDVLVEEEVLELAPDEELAPVVLLLMLLPQAATAPRHRTRVGTTNQLLQLRICSPHMPTDFAASIWEIRRPWDEG